MYHNNGQSKHPSQYTQHYPVGAYPPMPPPPGPRWQGPPYPGGHIPAPPHEEHHVVQNNTETDTVLARQKLQDERDGALRALKVIFPQVSAQSLTWILCKLIGKWITPTGSSNTKDNSTSGSRNGKELSYESYEPCVYSSHSVSDTLCRLTMPSENDLQSCKNVLQQLYNAYLDGEDITALEGIYVVLENGYLPWEPLIKGFSAHVVLKIAEELALLGPCALQHAPIDDIRKALQPPPRGGWLDLEDTSKATLVSTSSERAVPPNKLCEFMQSSQVKQLFKGALENLDVAKSIVGLLGTENSASAGNNTSSGVTGLSMSPSIDFSVRFVVSTRHLEQENVSLAEPQAVLATIAVQGPSTIAPHQNTNALSFASMAFESAVDIVDDVWLLGGIAAPQLPRTFGTVESSFFTLLEGSVPDHLANSKETSSSSAAAILLRPGRRHTFSFALCTLDGPERRATGELGCLQQALLFLIAVPSSSKAYHELPRVRGAAWHQVDEKWRVFVAARTMSAMLLDSAQSEARMALDWEAKPFIPPRLKQVFDSMPHMVINDLGDRILNFLGVDLQALQLQRGAPLQPRALSYQGTFANDPTIRRFHRLLQLEQHTMEKDICRHDMFNTRIQLAVFLPLNFRRYHLVNIRSREGKQHGGGNKQVHQCSGTQVKSVVAHSSKLTASVPVGKGDLGLHEVIEIEAQQKQSQEGGLYRGPAIDKAGIASFWMDSNKCECYLLAVFSVPGLPESRPGVVIGDCVYIRPANNETAEIVGVVAATDGTTCFIALPPQFWFKESRIQNKSLRALQCLMTRNNVDNSITPPRYVDCCKGLGGLPAFDGLVHVRFGFDKRPLEAMHAALDRVASLPFYSTLFSRLENEEISLKSLRLMQPAMAEVQYCADTLETTPAAARHRQLNPEQCLAVAAMLCGGGRTVPFALHGPPGTGKTVTLVACALQLLGRYPSSRLLLCAPQNYSADLLCSALHIAGIKKAKMLRLNDPRRPPFTVKDDVLSYSMLNETTSMFSIPPLMLLSQYSIIVTTCSAAIHLYHSSTQTTNLEPKLSFSHILMDEAGQALMPEALIPLGLLQPPNDETHRDWGAILCGDPQQLGPVIRSPAASAAGLGTSLPEQLIASAKRVDNELVATGKSTTMVMLAANYRSSSALLDLPSKMFYSDGLRAAADPSSVLLPQWEELSTEDEAQRAAAASVEEQQASLLFYGVRGEQAQEGDAHSYYNTLEAATICQLVEGLISSKTAAVQAGDVGIMATYRNQVRVIRTLLRKRGLGGVRVGTVDDYQGQEERIVFISTVLSRPRSILADGTSGDAHLSLWRNPRRFNVAITRAKSLLVVVGHPAVLLEDACWREMLRHCVKVGAFRGAGSSILRSRLMIHEERSPDIENAGDGDYDEDDELSTAIHQMADLALLGGGASALMYPQTLDEMMEAYAEETEWRVML